MGACGIGRPPITRLAAFQPLLLERFHQWHVRMGMGGGHRIEPLPAAAGQLQGSSV